MTKKEAKQVQEKIERYALRAALSWTVPVEPDVPIPTISLGDGSLTTGWLPCGDPLSHCGGRVEPACSSASSHGTGRIDKATSQQPRRLYGTKLLALRALRNAAEAGAARALLAIDRMIEAEEQEAGQ